MESRNTAILSERPEEAEGKIKELRKAVNELKEMHEGYLKQPNESQMMQQKLGRVWLSCHPILPGIPSS